MAFFVTGLIRVPNPPKQVQVLIMSEYMLIVNELRTQESGSSGKALQIQGICDMVEEFAGVGRAIFQKEMVHSRAIVDGAHVMWLKKQKAVAQRYLANQASYKDFQEIEAYFITLYELFHPTSKYDLFVFETYANRMARVPLHLLPDFLTDEEQAEQAEYDARYEEEYEEYMNNQWND